MNAGEVLSFYGKTDGVAVGGTLGLDSDVLYSSVNYIRPDKGVESKIWTSKVSGKPASLFLEQTEDITVGTEPNVGAPWKKIAPLHLASEGELHEDQRHPIKLTSRDGKQAFRVVWLQTAAGLTYFLIKVEFTYKGM